MGDEKGLTVSTKIAKVDEELGLVLGYAIICKKGNEDYYDLQGDHIPEDQMLKAALDFAENANVAKEMHSGDKRGAFPFMFPLTTDIAKSFGLEASTTGFMVAVRPDKDMLSKYKSGELTGFSIGGEVTETPEAVNG